ncbi:MAG: efflux RND transporter periplasmic adaptor subunit [Marinifilaceae bacterium]
MMKKIKYINTLIAIFITALLLSCGNTVTKETKQESEHEDEEDVVSLTKEQANAIDLKVGDLKQMNLSSFIVTNGIIAVPPQQKIDVSAIIGANIADIKVLEGQNVNKGQILAILEHPDLIDIQVEFKTAYNNLTFLEKEHKRLKTLSDKNIASGKEFQQVESDYNTARTSFIGLKSKLEIIGINVKKLISGEVQRYIPVKAPIDGVISQINVNKGKYAEPQTEMFEIINTKHLHANLAIYEKDITKVKKGQKVIITLNENDGNEYKGKIITVGKNFDETSRAIHVQVEMSPVPEELVPGIFIKGRIITGDQLLTAVPKDAIVTEGDKSYIFIVDEHEEGNDEHGHKADIAVKLKMIEVVKGISDRGFIEIKLLEKLDSDVHIALNGAYFLLAEMKKAEAEHSH